jgi:hypothetical protein
MTAVSNRAGVGSVIDAFIMGEQSFAAVTYRTFVI